MSSGNVCDPRTRLVRDKYFSLRPQPLERWLWAQGIPASAERVFWLHWQEGFQRGDWCSELPLKRVARECCVDLSTVTRAYQLLGRLGCIRRTDPGRDPANPFNQATAVTEVCIPRELVMELHQHPNRRTESPKASIASVRAVAIASDRPESADEERTPADPFAGMGAKARFNALSELTKRMSAAERSHYRETAQTHKTQMQFDADSKLSALDQDKVSRFLTLLAGQPTRITDKPEPTTHSPPQKIRRLSVFELARLRRDIQSVTDSQSSHELLRQVVWSVEEGALRRFEPRHALHIALKKIREGAWNRPHRMPPNWLLQHCSPALPETCRRA